MPDEKKQNEDPKSAEIEPLSDQELEDAAGGAALDDSNAGCSCNNCSAAV